MTRFRKRPVEIDAIQWHGEDNCAEVFAFLGLDHPVDELDHSEIHVTTIHGETATVRPGDWIAREPVPGRFYPIKPDIFARSYEPADQPSAPADTDLRERVARAVDDVFDRWRDGLGDQRPEDAITDAVLAVLPVSAVLTATERSMLGFALEMAQEEIHARSLESSADDRAALVSLRRMADEAQQAGESRG
ncbi:MULTISPECIES: hypothetical protein [unclassified Streptomyces]|uniref:hypothetical protein n=1 Tax=unclassified Streptomyces TaxID=2593676 RepID=UPI00278BC02C|nr:MULTISPECIES: hypothetical protein [unclassified Streptomyces]